MIIPMLCVTIFVILVVWFLLPRVARLMIHTPTAISIFVCLSMVQLMAVFISMLGMKTYNWEGVNPDGYFLDKLEPIPSALPSFQKLFQVSATALSIP